MTFTAEAVKALALMPVPLLDYEIDSSKAPKLESIKHTTTDNTKLAYLGYYITGSGEQQEIIPHAMQMEASINEWGPHIGQLERVLAFKKSLLGTALATANKVLDLYRQNLINQDNQLEGNRTTFHDFMVAYCHEFGHTEDKHNQREGIRYMKKTHREISTGQWKHIIKDKNDAVNYMQGHGRPHPNEEMNRIFFNGMPEVWKDTYTSNGSNDISTATLESILTFMKQQEATSKAKSAANSAKQALERKRGRDDTKSNGNGKGSSWKNPKKFRRYGKDPKDKSKGKDTSGKCRRCSHDHLWKDCFYNPKNPNNKLQQFANKGKSNKGNNKDAGHSHVMAEVPNNNTGFELPGKENATTTKGKPKRHMLSTLTESTNTHHIDCLSLHHLEQHLDHSMPPLNASKEQIACLSGNNLEQTNLTRSRSSGMSPSAIDAKETEELRCLYQAVEDITSTLYSDESDLFEKDINVEFSYNNNDNSNRLNQPRLSEHDIVPGADTPMTIITIGTIQDKESKRPLRALVDSGSKRSYIYRSALPLHTEATTIEAMTTRMLDRTTSINSAVTLKDIILPELSATTRI